jgi:RimJ/RimL family protein N-acetyltransferase
MVTLRPWTRADLPILRKTLGDPTMMEHLGGIETEAQILQRHERYLRAGEPASGRMFTIGIAGGYEIAGSIGFWETAWRGEPVYETGWLVLPEYAGRGIATSAAREIVNLAKKAGKHRFLHAFPAVGNVPSNAVCRKAGFVISARKTLNIRKVTSCVVTFGASIYGD